MSKRRTSVAKKLKTEDSSIVLSVAKPIQGRAGVVRAVVEREQRATIESCTFDLQPLARATVP